MGKNSDVFLEKYKELEDFIRGEYGLKNEESAIAFLLKRPEYRSIRDELDYCREVRNLLQHKPKIRDNYVVEASDAMISLLEGTLNRIKNPPKARRIMIPRQQILCKAMNDLVLPTMREMDEKVYTHIPILENEVVCGVFSENTVLSYLVDEQIGFDETTTFSEIADYLPLDKHRAETFRFVHLDEFISNISDEFDRAVHNQDRIGMVFVTANGKKSEKLLGILTAWDIAAW